MDISWIVYILIIFGGITIGGYKVRKLNSSSQKSWLLLILVLIIEVIAHILRLKNENNLIIYHISTSLYLVIFYWIFKTEIYLPLNTSIFTLTIVIITIINGLFFQKFTEAFPSNLYLFSSFLIIVFSLLYLHEFLKTNDVINIFDFPLFIISIGLLFFHSINLFGFGAFKFIYFQQNKSFALIFTLIRKLSNYVLYSTFIFAFFTKQNSISK